MSIRNSIFYGHFIHFFTIEVTFSWAHVKRIPLQKIYVRPIRHRPQSNIKQIKTRWGRGWQPIVPCLGKAKIFKNPKYDVFPKSWLLTPRLKEFRLTKDASKEFLTCCDRLIIDKTKTKYPILKWSKLNGKN